jgi:opacity protein-like surface antigen
MRHHAVLSAVCFAAASLAAPAHAGDLTGVDAATSTVMQEGQSSFSGIAVRMRFHPSALIRNIEVMPTIEYWRNSSSLSAFGIESTRKDATLGVDARYVFYRDGWEPYVGAGFGLHFLTSSVNAPSYNLNHATDSFSKGGLTALVGVGVPLTTHIQNFIEIKYHHVTENRQLKLNWGISYNL